jgi:hypothetical protein
MNKHRILQLAVLVVLAVLALFVIQRKPQMQPVVTDFQSCQEAGGILTDGDPVVCTINDQNFEEEQNPEPEVVLDTPSYGGLVSSPLHVSGKAKGFWFFEANIPVTLKDQNGKVLAQKGFMATSDWMTPEYVPFEGDLEFSTPETEFGVLIINKDNPSGLPEHDASYAIPVRFK